MLPDNLTHPLDSTSTTRRATTSAADRPQDIPDLTAYLQHLHNRGKSANTVAAYGGDLRQFVRFTAVSCADDILPSHVEAWETWLRTLRGRAGGPLNPASITRKYVALRRFTAWAKATGRAAKNRGKGLDLPKAREVEPRYIPVHLVFRMLAAMPTQGPTLTGRALNLRDKAFLEVMAATGARLSEVAGIRLIDFRHRQGDDQETTMVYIHGKGGTVRKIPVTPYAMGWITAYLRTGRPHLASRGSGHTDAGEDGVLFLSAKGVRLSRSAAGRIFPRAAARVADMPEGACAHSLRWLFATEMSARGQTVQIIATLMGHQSVDTTRRYIVTGDESMILAVRDGGPMPWRRAAA